MKQQHTDPNRPVFLTAAELATRWKVTQMTLRRWRTDGRLKTHHFGRNIRFSLAEVERLEADALA